MNKHYIDVIRVDHWFKNIIVFIGVLGAMEKFDILLSYKTLLISLMAFFLSCLISSFNYAINEILDAKYDAKHPLKRDRPIPSGKLKVKNAIVFALILVTISLGAAIIFFPMLFVLSILALLVAGFFYNVEPMRTKDKPYIDVISESINNPIRICIGWFALAPENIFPPMLVLILIWVFGCFLMNTKRVTELKFLGKKKAEEYRKVFKYYNVRPLTILLLIYAVLSIILFIQFVFSFEQKLIYAIPFVLLFFIWWFKMVMGKDEVTMHPEKIYRKPSFLLYCISLSVFIAILLF